MCAARSIGTTASAGYVIISGIPTGGGITVIGAGGIITIGGEGTVIAATKIIS